MKEVTKKEFYMHVGNVDSVYSIDPFTKYPYTGYFKMRHSGRMIGKTIDSFTDGVVNRYPIVTKYYIQ